MPSEEGMGAAMVVDDSDEDVKIRRVVHLGGICLCLDCGVACTIDGVRIS